MRAIRRVSAGTVAAVLLLGSSTVVLGQERASDEDGRYLFGEVAGFLHHNVDNPLDCDIGFTSEETGTGTSTLLGTVTVIGRNCYVPTDTYQNMTKAVLTITAENGDVLELEGRDGNCLPDDVPAPGGVYSCSITDVVVSGTGAFEGASGEVHGIAYTTNAQSDHPDAAPGDVPFRLIFEGLIEY
jgi:hypothetical protein